MDKFSRLCTFYLSIEPFFSAEAAAVVSSPHWWLEQEEGRPLQPAQMNDWMRAEGHYLARLLRGPLHWWGISDLALSGEGRLLAFRLTPMADLLLNGIELPEQADVQSDQVSTSFLDVLETGELLVSCTPGAWPLIELIEDF